MSRRFMKDALGWGFALWAIGYALGIILFAFVPPSLIGWIITPFGTAITLWITFTKVKGDTLRYFGLVGLVWLLIAVVVGMGQAMDTWLVTQQPDAEALPRLVRSLVGMIRRAMEP